MSSKWFRISIVTIVALAVIGSDALPAHGQPEAPFELLASFPPPAIPGGSSPQATLVQGSDGRFYGTTQSGWRG